MHWFKRDMWKIGIIAADILLFLVLIIWVPVSAAATHARVPELTTLATIMVQTTPTVDTTMTALNKEKLAQEVQQLENQNEPNPLGWLQTNASILLSTLVVVIGALIGFWQWRVGRRDTQNKELEDHKAERERRDLEQKRWLRDQEAEREKRAEERFQSAVTGLGDEKEGAKIGAAILLRTFLRPDYEQFYIQTFDLTVAHLRLRRSFFQLSEEDPNTPLPLSTLRQALIVAFKESFPLAQGQKKGSPQSLDATNIQLDNAYLAKAYLHQVWMPQASLQKANLKDANLKDANLKDANLTGADLTQANLRGANLTGADLTEADLTQADLSGGRLTGADLTGADLTGANLSGALLAIAKFIKANLTWARLNEAKLVFANLNEANLSKANLRGANLTGANLSRANLTWANLSGADLSEANLIQADLSGADLTEANLRGTSLKDTNLQGVKGLTKEQLEICNRKGAILDEDSIARLSQSTPSITLLLQSNSTPAQLETSASGSSKTHNPDAGSATTSKSESDP